jgi:DNA-directed RNA polymerase subunit RPC12/RpoP
MAEVDLKCLTCKNEYHLTCKSLTKDEEKNCPECGSPFVRQTFASFRRNGGLVDPRWVNPDCGGSSSFG